MDPAVYLGGREDATEVEREDRYIRGGGDELII